MTFKPSPSDPKLAGPIWDRALDWLLRVQAAPEDRQLRASRDAWLAQDASHLQAYRRAEQVWRVTGAVPRPAQPKPSGKWWRQGFTLAAAALAACLLLWLASDLGVLLRADYRTGAGEVRDVPLPDGSIVSLDADSAIAVPADRAVALLDGRAFFQVTRDAVHPFTVAAGAAKVTVLGTAFDVLLSDRAVTVFVQSGSVSVTADPARAVTLQAGQRAIVDRADGSIETSTISTAGIAAWRRGKLVVDGAPVADVLEELSRHYSGVILLRDPILGARRITGVFDLRDPDAALRAVLQPYGGRILRLTPYLLVVDGR
ncbi:FecR family protein [Dongia deserti]|uniref:FecR family protein n=1 Tax=Dongia deserti TaxID=2268030 RepID=UPI000E649AB5|nr:FecR domain-containing protein [Dongia deserti]